MIYFYVSYSVTGSTVKTTKSERLSPPTAPHDTKNAIWSHQPGHLSPNLSFFFCLPCFCCLLSLRIIFACIVAKYVYIFCCWSRRWLFIYADVLLVKRCVPMVEIFEFVVSIHSINIDSETILSNCNDERQESFIPNVSPQMNYFLVIMYRWTLYSRTLKSRHKLFVRTSSLSHL